MPAIHRETVWRQLAVGLVATAALAGCAGHTDAGRHDASDTRDPVPQGGTGGQALNGAPGGTSTNIDAPTTGGVPTSPPGSDIGGVSGGGPELLPRCPAAELFAQVNVFDPTETAMTPTEGKVQVSVTVAEEGAPYSLDSPADLRHRHYVLHGSTKDWTLDLTIPGLTREMIKVGDVLNFQLETSPGQVPLSQATNQAFGLFAQGGELLLFAALTVSYSPVPDLSFLGLEVTDNGVACGSFGFQCLYAVHRAHFTAPTGAIDLLPGHSAQLGDLEVGVEAFQSALASSGGTCDDSGISLVFGVRKPSP